MNRQKTKKKLSESTNPCQLAAQVFQIVLFNLFLFFFNSDHGGSFILKYYAYLSDLFWSDFKPAILLIPLEKLQSEPLLAGRQHLQICWNPLLGVCVCERNPANRQTKKHKPVLADTQRP